MEKIIDVRDLSVYFGKKQVLKNIDISVEKNKITAIMGPSGCGKSTFLKTLNGITKENTESNVKGQILFNGKETNEMPLDKLRKSIGCVFQTPAPFPFSIYKNINYVLKYYGVKDKDTAKNIIKDKLELVGLYEEIKEDLNMSALKLSGGQQQRLCIARALAAEPEVLLMDEPCSALDVRNTAIIEKMLLELKKHYTIVIVTHNLAQAKRISDKTIFMLDGEIIEVNKTNKMFENPKDERTLNYIQGIFG
ncbi:phosphate ABC transporter ATP-binding protein [Clostridium niameyense]|uniref:phosphate ABC transporter ATP-binding protein n=1 Tax=Clostridium niameyense TaxID=1622073 RepID=UPI00067E776E|nr:phosphate ABC transporter ATP-binding protein [Clostridium niameyense]